MNIALQLFGAPPNQSLKLTAEAEVETRCARK
jgi:hypothetical protein